MTIRSIQGLLATLIGIAALAFGASSSAQPMRETDEGVFVTLPERVDVHPDGRIELVTREVGPLGPMDPLPPIPTQVETWTILQEGLPLRGMMVPEDRFGSYMHPQQIVFDDAGYELVRRIHCWTFEHFPAAKPAPAVTKAAVRSVLREWPVTVRPRADAIVTREKRGANFDVQFLVEENTYPPGQLENIQSMLGRIERRFEKLLRNDAGLARIRFRFDPNLPPGFAAGTTPEPYVYPYFQVKNSLLIHAGVDNESAPEITMYEQLPPGMEVPVKYTGLPQTSQNLMALPSPLAIKWVLPITGAQEATTLVAPSDLWNYNILEGALPGKIDLENTLTHEFVHALGFVSTIETNEAAPPAAKTLTVWNLFRLDEESVGASLTLTAFRTLPRMLDANNEAVAGLEAFSSQGILRVSRGAVPGIGDGFRSDHWKELALLRSENPTATLIGLMDPAASNRQILYLNDYLQPADLGAIDQIGWNIDRAAPPAAPVPVIPQAPANGQVNAPYSPSLIWSGGSGATSRNLYMYAGAALSADGPFYKIINVVGSTHTIPPGVLAAGSTYLWFVTSVNDYSFRFSAQRTFTTLPACSGDADGDRDRDFADINSVLTNWNAMYQPAPPGVFAGDANGDGIVNFADTTAVLQSFGLACP